MKRFVFGDKVMCGSHRMIFIRYVKNGPGLLNNCYCADKDGLSGEDSKDLKAGWDE